MNISTHILTKRMTRFFIHIILRINISTHILTKRMTICLFFFRQYSEHISTHILTKRMTRYPSTQSESALYFNSHPHEEDDGQWGNITGNYGNFNSHPHEEDDGILSFLWKTSAGISTHILTKRMTVSNVVDPVALSFQLTSSRRGWPNRSAHWSESPIFQLTSSRRGWRLILQVWYRRKLFQLTSSRRGWPG